MIDLQSLQANGLWGAIHELGHNQQQSEWEFPPHTTEATCSLWSVYVNETVLGIPRDKAHNALTVEFRKKRIQDYIKNGAQLKDWEVFTALETYLQVICRQIKLATDLQTDNFNPGLLLSVSSLSAST